MRAFGEGPSRGHVFGGVRPVGIALVPYIVALASEVRCNLEGLAGEAVYGPVPRCCSELHPGCLPLGSTFPASDQPRGIGRALRLVIVIVRCVGDGVVESSTPFDGVGGGDAHDLDFDCLKKPSTVIQPSLSLVPCGLGRAQASYL